MKPLISLPLLALIVALFFMVPPGDRTEPPPTMANIGDPCPVPTNRDFSGKQLNGCNFNRVDLRNADFSNATLTAVVFIGADLTGAVFDGATFAASPNPATPNDFTLATLTNASFADAKFVGTTFFSYATLTCTNFWATAQLPASQRSLGATRFGPAALNLDAAAACPGSSDPQKPKPLRTSFAGRPLTCEFVADWVKLDLTGADIGACAALLATPVDGNNQPGPGHDFSGGMFAGVVFDGIDLRNSKWARADLSSGADLTNASFQNSKLDGATGLNGIPGANPGDPPKTASKLRGAKFNRASVRNVNMNAAALNGANFSYADLTGSTFDSSSFVLDTTVSQTPATFQYAHLKNVSMQYAKLDGVSFSAATLYGSFGGGLPPTGGCADATQCTSLSGASLSKADFSNAFLYGVDFTGPAGAKSNLSGAIFSNAVLVASDMQSVTFDQGPPKFNGALMQGVKFSDDIAFNGADFGGAYLDFGLNGSTKGNFMAVWLGTAYTGFTNRADYFSVTTPCLLVAYPNVSVVPPGAPLGTCPNGSTPDKQTNCGRQITANRVWYPQSPLASLSGNVRAGYKNGTTYEAATPGLAQGNPSAVCGANSAYEQNW